MTKYKPKPMTKGQFASLKMLTAYNYEDEKAHWESVGKPSENHIFLDIQRLQDYEFNCEQFVGSKTDETKDD